MKLEQKNVFITGSSRGIGLAIAHKFANVVLNSRGEISEELLAEFKPYGVKVLAISGDVSDFADAKRMADQAIEELGSVDVLVNNAGITQDTLLLKMTEVDFEKVLKVNLTGAFNMTQAVLKPMIKAREGAIINMSSVVGLMGNIGQANYAASKAGVNGFTKAIAKEGGKYGISCNAVCPSFTITDMTTALSSDEEKYKKVVGIIPLGRPAQASEPAQMVLFFASDAASFVNGEVGDCDGGIVMD